MTPTRTARTRGALAVAAGLCLLAGACGGDTTSAAADGAEASSEGGAPRQIAFLTASSANTWLASSKEVIDEMAAESDIEVTEFDGQFNPAEQTKQIQDVVASGQYDAIVISPIDGAGVIPDLEAAIADGIEVAILNQAAGTDLTTSDPQFDGVAVSVLVPARTSGERVGTITAEACADLDPCHVVYFYGIKGSPLDTAIREGFDEVTDGSGVDVVAEGEGKYLGPDEALKGMQDILQTTSDIDVVVGPDQAIQGVQLALDDAGMSGDVALVGFGGSGAAIDGVADGTWFGDVFGAPRTEARLLMEALVAVLDGGEPAGGIDPATALPDDGLVTQDNVEEFTPEWAG